MQLVVAVLKSCIKQKMGLEAARAHNYDLASDCKKRWFPSMGNQYIYL